MQRRTLRTATETLADRRQVRVTCSTETLGRDDVILVSSGIDLAAYKRNPVWLWQHNPDWPVARSDDVTIQNNKLVALVQFPPKGASERADEVFALIQAGIINAASTGFETLEAEPIDPQRHDGGIRITRCELQEMSFVAIPAVPDALISERANGNPAEGWKCGAAADLPLNERDEWDGDAARERVFRWAGFDGNNPDPVKARRAFLAYNASAPLLRRSYKLPFADYRDGRLVAVRRGLEAAASMLDRTDIPERERARARQIIKSYEGKESDVPARKNRPSQARGWLQYHRKRAQLYQRAPADEELSSEHPTAPPHFGESAYSRRQRRIAEADRERVLEDGQMRSRLARELQRRP